MIQLQDQFSQAVPLALVDQASGSLAIGFGDEVLLIRAGIASAGGGTAPAMSFDSSSATFDGITYTFDEDF